MVPDDQPLDLAEEYFRPYVRPLGNIVILYANAEAALRDFVMQVLWLQCKGEAPPEAEAHKIVGDKNWQTKVAPLIESCGIDQNIDELRATLKEYAEAKEERNRLAHDEWHLAIDVDNPKNASVAIRGFKGRRGAELVHGGFSVDQLWQLAHRFARAQLPFELG